MRKSAPHPDRDKPDAALVWDVPTNATTLAEDWVTTRPGRRSAITSQCGVIVYRLASTERHHCPKLLP